MQIRLTVLGQHGARAPYACDVLVTAPAGTALAAVASGLAAAVAGGTGAGAGDRTGSPSAAGPGAGADAAAGAAGTGERAVPGSPGATPGARPASGARQVPGQGTAAQGGGSGPVVLYSGSERLDSRRCLLGEPPLVDGAVLSLNAPAEPGLHPGVAQEPAAGAAARLHVVAGPDAGGVHLLHGGQVRIGRSGDADVPLDDPDVSRLHCAVTVADDGMVTVADLGSTNGTALDGSRVDARPRPLRPGSLLRLGESALRLEPAPEPGAGLTPLPAPVPASPDGEGHLRIVLGGGQGEGRDTAHPAREGRAGTPAGQLPPDAAGSPGGGRQAADPGRQGVPGQRAPGQPALGQEAAPGHGGPGQEARRHGELGPGASGHGAGPGHGNPGQATPGHAAASGRTAQHGDPGPGTPGHGAASGHGNPGQAAPGHTAVAGPAVPLHGDPGPGAPGGGSGAGQQWAGHPAPGGPAAAGAGTSGGRQPPVPQQRTTSGHGHSPYPAGPPSGPTRAGDGTASIPGTGAPEGTGRRQGTPVRGSEVPPGLHNTDGLPGTGPASAGAYSGTGRDHWSGETRRTERRSRGIGAWARRLAGGWAADEKVQTPPLDGPAAGRPDALAAAEGAALHRRWPDPSDILLTALGPGPRLWERGPEHPDALVVRLGTADRPGAPSSPVTVSLRQSGSLGLAGPRARLAGLARSVLAQLAALHSPAVLEIVLISTDRSRDVRERMAEWGWLGWLPQLRPAHGQDCRLLLAYDHDQAAARVAELVRRLDEPPSPRTPDPTGTHSAAAPATPDGGGRVPSAGSADATSAPGPAGTYSRPGAAGAAGADDRTGVYGRTGAAGTADARGTAGAQGGAGAAGTVGPAGAGGAYDGTGAAGAGSSHGTAGVSGAAGPPYDGPYTVVVVDGDPGSAALREATARLAAAGRSAGVHLICLAETPAASPTAPLLANFEAARSASPAFGQCGAVAMLSGDVATALRLIHLPAPHAPARSVTPPEPAPGEAPSPYDAAASAGRGGGQGPAAGPGPQHPAEASGEPAGHARAGGPGASGGTVPAGGAVWPGWPAGTPGAAAYDGSGTPGSPSDGSGTPGSAPDGSGTQPGPPYTAPAGPPADGGPAAAGPLYGTPAGGPRPGVLGNGTGAIVDAVSAAWAERFARSLAPLRAADADPAGAGGPGQSRRVAVVLPRTARLLDELGLARATPASLMARWAAAADAGQPAGGHARAVLGAGPHGPLALDVAADGPHVLVEGGPGTGKTELLRSLAASLASADRPDRLSLALVDGGGMRTPLPEARGSEKSEGLRVCTDLPHVSTYLPCVDPVRMREFAQALISELKRRAELLGELDFGQWHARQEEAAAHRAAGRRPSERPGAADRRSGDPEPEPSGTLKLRVRRGEEPVSGRAAAPPSSGQEPGPGAEPAPAAAAGPAALPRLVVIVDDLDALLSPALGSTGRPAAGSVVRALESAARHGARLGVHLVAATGHRERTAGTALAETAGLRIALEILPAATDGPEPAEATAGRGRLSGRDGTEIPFQAGRVTGRIPRTATLRPTVVPLDWERMGDPPTRRPLRELGNGPTDLALLASALQRAAQSAAAPPSPPLV